LHNFAKEWLWCDALSFEHITGSTSDWMDPQNELGSEFQLSLTESKVLDIYPVTRLFIHCTARILRANSCVE
jgi:hypothetical protein